MRLTSALVSTRNLVPAIRSRMRSRWLGRWPLLLATVSDGLSHFLTTNCRGRDSFVPWDQKPGGTSNDLGWHWATLWIVIDVV